MEDSSIMEDDVYIPVAPIIYNYNAKFCSLTDICPTNITESCNIYMCAYDVNVDGKEPFLRYLLTSHLGDENKLEFQMVPKLSTLHTINEYVDYAYMCLGGMLVSSDDKACDQIKFSGYYIFNGDIYLFYNVTMCKLQIYDVYRANSFWFLLIDEIINHKQMCDIPVDASVVDLFTNNPELCFLTDVNNVHFEMPISCYAPKSGHMLELTATFGQSLSDKMNIFGPYYYFSNFTTSFSNIDIGDPFKLVDNITHDNNRKPRFGLVRFAVFLGVNKIVENFPNDAVDKSDIKQQRLNDHNLDAAIERLTMRISDHDGTWAENYDSVYLGPLDLDNGAHVESNLVAVKNYNQQIPLSYHYIDRRLATGDVTQFRIE